MDEHLIIEFQTKAQADTCLAVINQIAAAYWTAQGYTVIDGELVPKNAATGEDDLTAQRTKTWDVAKESPDNTWYISSPANDERFLAWRDRLPEGLVFPADKPFPIEWIPTEE